jgi:glutathione S-transferase
MRTVRCSTSYCKINPPGYVPVLQIDDEVHTEVSALLQHLAEQAVRDKLATRFAEFDAFFATRPYLTGVNFTVADAYAFTIFN